MRVVTNKFGEINIRWQYGLVVRKREVTKAFLEKDKEVVAEASTKKHNDDIYDKELARKSALTKLVKENFSRVEDLEDRKGIWKAYIGRKVKKEEAKIEE